MNNLSFITKTSPREMQTLQEPSLMSNLKTLATSTAALAALGVIALSFAAMLLTGMFVISNPWIFLAAISSSLIIGIGALFYTYCKIAESRITSAPYLEDRASFQPSPTFAASATNNPISNKPLEHTNGITSSNEPIPTSAVTESLASSSSAPIPAGSIIGLWATRELNHEPPKGLMAIYEHNGMYYGKVLVTYVNGKINDTILEKKYKAPGVKITGVTGNPPYCGMDMVYNLKKMNFSDNTKQKYSGNFIDPDTGVVIAVELQRSGTNLTVDAFVCGINVRSVTWDRAHTDDIPQGFSLEMIKDFVPNIPVPKKPFFLF